MITMLLHSLPTFNFLAPNSSVDSLKLRSSEFLSPIPLRIATDFRYKDCRRSNPTTGSQQNPTETAAVYKKNNFGRRTFEYTNAGGSRNKRPRFESRSIIQIRRNPFYPVWPFNPQQTLQILLQPQFSVRSRTIT